MNGGDLLKNTITGFRPDILLRNPVLFVTEISMILSLFAYIFHGFFNLPFSASYQEFYISV